MRMRTAVVGAGIAAMALVAAPAAQAATLVRDRYTLTFTPDVDAGTIEFAVVSDQAGWFALGIAPAGRGTFHSNEHDVFVMWDAGGGVGAGEDAFSGVGLIQASSDDSAGGSQDYTLVSAVSTNGKLSANWTRLLDTGDAKDAVIIDGNVRVTAGYSQFIGSGVSPNTVFPQHAFGDYEQFEVNLLDENAVAIEDGYRLDPGYGLLLTAAAPFVLYALYKQLRACFKSSTRTYEVRSPVGNWARDIASRASMQILSYTGLNGLENASADGPVVVPGPGQGGSGQGGSGQGGIGQGGIGQGGFGGFGGFGEKNFVRGNLPPKNQGPGELGPLGRVARAISQWSRHRILWYQVSRRQGAVMLFFLVAAFFWAVVYDQDFFPAELAFGYVACASALLTVVPATRNSILTWFLFKPFERMVIFHRWLGRFTWVAVALHAVMYYAQWSRDGVFKHNFQVKKYRDGLISFMFLTVILLTSLDWVRRRYYSFFKLAHYSFFGFYIWAVLHTDAFFTYMILSVVLYATDIFMRYALGLFPVNAYAMDVLPGEVTRIRFPKNKYVSYEAGQYVFLNFPSVSLSEWHPYTLSSGPHEEFLEVHIKALGDHTRQLLAAGTKLGANSDNGGIGRGGEKKLPRVRVDGPYGRISFNHKRYQNIMLVGGGVGVTPLISVLKELYQIGMTERARTTHPLSPYVKNIFFVWVVPSTEPFSWFFETLQVALQTASMGASFGFPNLYVVGFVTKEDSHLRSLQTEVKNTRNCSVTSGRPNFQKTFGAVESHLGSGNHRVAVMTCGPTKMVNTVWDTAVKRTGKQFTYDFHNETFNF